ncbi:MAG: hypothetical protein WBA97_28765 [Actinophytocola sp.]|uniref:hypothetical protein n=1 Tax=Actinophytocola sp. TaxID=1872138 RepID=UPI003C70A0FE
MTVGHDDPDDHPEFDIRELERYLAGETETGRAADTPRIRKRDQARRTRRVRKLASDVAEAREIVALQDSTELVTAYSSRVLRTLRQGAEAEKLVRLRQQPAFIALATVRARRIVTTTGLIALTIALGWSTAGVQGFAAGEALAFSPPWWLAWGVEPFVSLALLTIVIARAFLASRGQWITAPAVRRAELLFLGATLVMNVWRYLPGVADDFRVDQLVVHMLGPIVAVCVVTVLPVLWVAIDHVPDSSDQAFANGSDPGDRSTGSEDELPQAVDERVASALLRAQELIQVGKLPPTPSANAVHKALGGAMDTARAVRDILRRGP